MDFVFKDNAESICRWKTGTLPTISSMTVRVDELLVSIEKLKSWGRRTVHFAPWSGQNEPMDGAHWTNWQPCIHYRKLFICTAVVSFLIHSTIHIDAFVISSAKVHRIGLCGYKNGVGRPTTNLIAGLHILTMIRPTRTIFHTNLCRTVAHQFAVSAQERGETENCTINCKINCHWCPTPPTA